MSVRETARTVRIRQAAREIMSLREHVSQRDIAVDVALLQVEVISLRMHIFDREIGSHSYDMVGAFFASCLMKLHLDLPFKAKLHHRALLDAANFPGVSTNQTEKRWRPCRVVRDHFCIFRDRYVQGAVDFDAELR